MLERARPRGGGPVRRRRLHIVTGGETITGRENFKRWVAGFLATINDLHLEVLESF
jgi:hypothetical protein